MEDHDKGSWPALDEDTSALVGPIRQIVDVVVVEAQGHVSTQPRATVVVAADITLKQSAMKIPMDIVGLAQTHYTTSMPRIYGFNSDKVNYQPNASKNIDWQEYGSRLIEGSSDPKQN